MHIGIIGSTGLLGRRLAALLAGQHRVRCLARPGRELAGVRTTPADLLQAASLPAAVEGLDVLVNLASSQPDAEDDARCNWAQNDRLRVAGTANLVEALQRANPGCRLVQPSVAMLHPGDRLCDETAEVIGHEMLTSAIVMEAIVQRSGLDWVLPRAGALYGPGSARDDAFFARIAQGRLLAPDCPRRWISFIHVDDLAAALVRAATLPGRLAYLVVDDHPVTYAELFAGVAGGAAPAPGARALRALPSFRVSNRRLRDFGWAPAHADVFAFARRAAERAGLAHAQAA